MRLGLGRAVIAPALAIASMVLTVSVAARADGGAVFEARVQIETTLAQMRAGSIHVRDQLRLTRKRGTKAQVVCVDEALSRSDVALRHGRALGDEILAAYARNDPDGAHAGRARLVELHEAQRAASKQAAKCTPTALPALPLASTSTTTVRVDIDPNIPRVD